MIYIFCYFRINIPSAYMLYFTAVEVQGLANFIFFMYGWIV